MDQETRRLAEEILSQHGIQMGPAPPPEAPEVVAARLEADRKVAESRRDRTPAALYNMGIEI
ncbi:MAG: hypothetical protein AB1758_37055 [Candidatus Eremiobacterota bacterium]